MADEGAGHTSTVSGNDTTISTTTGGTEQTDVFRVFETEEDFQRAIDEAEARGRSRGVKQGERKSTLSKAERDELDTLRTQREEQERSQALERGEFEKLEKRLRDEHTKTVTDRESQITRLREELKHDRCHLELMRAATGRAFNPEQVARLLSDQVALTDEGKAIVLDLKAGDGSPRYSSATEPMTPAELVEEFLTKPENANLVKAQNAVGGSGAGGSVTTSSGKGDAQIADLEQQKAKILEEARQHPAAARAAAMQVLQLDRKIRQRQAELS